VREPLAGFPDHGPLNETILRNAYQEVAGARIGFLSMT
jgi:hypothetical protein